ncbi:asparagine synthase-related protein [Parahaliea mediterranea]|uniref:asparagine synthase (glutamine-hydrolyzing) n=1 Tax=Parahaliea mediterranea TaxID=651086 RepID=A0A939DGG8_9GAMM|nr:hypothetical protein [Parahaliea mediterranea]
MNQFQFPAIAGCLLPGGTAAQLPLSRLSGHAAPAFTQRQAGKLALASTGSCASDIGGLGLALCGNPRLPASCATSIEDTLHALAARFQSDRDRFLEGVGGDYCLSVVDPANNSVTLAVDKYASHPLYFTCGEDGVVRWSSLPTLLLDDDGFEATADIQGLYNYCYFHMVPGPGSIFRGIGKLQAAEVVRIDGSGIHRQRHWEPDFNRPRKVSDYQRNCGELRERLRAGVRRCMAADMNTGSFLSGGLDSSTVTGFLAEATGGKAPAFAIGFDAPGYDEMAYARTTARHFGVTLHEYYVTPDDVVEALPLIAGSFEEPFGNSSALPAYFCARVARNHGIDCLLAGDGGDELFAGNERYARQKVFSVYHQLPSVLRNQLLEPVLRALPASTPLAGKARSYVDQATTPLPDRLQSYNFLHRHDPGELFGSDVLSRIDTNQPLELLRAIYRRPANATELDRMLYLDWQITLADNDLRKVSHTCALAGIGVRFPMLDDDLLEFSCTLPDDWKLPRQKLRQFYKNALADWLPQETLRKKKQGFGLPFGVWMQEYAPLRELAYDTLLQLKRRPLFRPEFIDNTIELHRSRHAAYYGELVWILTVLELWMQSHGVDF